MSVENFSRMTSEVLDCLLTEDEQRQRGEAALAAMIRVDTGELVSTRQMTDAEKQRALPFAARQVN